jgi:integrase
VICILLAAGQFDGGEHMARHRLNPALLRTLVKPGAYPDGEGLYLRVRGPEQRAWAYRYMLRGKATWAGLGGYPGVGLAEARERADAARKLAKAGTDPVADKRAREAEKLATEATVKAEAVTLAHTFDKVAAAYIAAHKAGWRNAKHRQQWGNTLDTYASPVIGKLPVAAIETGHVTAILEPIWQEKPETAGRVRGRIEAVLDYAKVRGWRAGENPARWRGHLDHLLPARGKVRRVEHHAALPWREVSTFMAMLAQQEGIAALALRFAILTAARTGEAIGATWAEIDTAGAVWTVPGERMKAGREHRVPLSDAALAVLADAAKLRAHAGPDAPVFPGQRLTAPISNMAMLMLLRRMGRHDLTAHGFRSTFRDWVAEATNHPGEVAEAALAHTLGDKTEAAYQRGTMMEKRRRLMGDWAAYCSNPAPPENVVTLHPAAAA